MLRQSAIAPQTSGAFELPSLLSNKSLLASYTTKPLHKKHRKRKKYQSKVNNLDIHLGQKINKIKTNT